MFTTVVPVVVNTEYFMILTTERIKVNGVVSSTAVQQVEIQRKYTYRH